MPASAAIATRPGPRPSTSREKIVKVAIRLLSRDGIDALSFRGVARELGVTVGALSRYFKNLADLRDAVAGEVISRVSMIDPKGRRGMRQQLVDVGMDWLEVNRLHPYVLLIEGPASASAAARHVTRNIQAMIDSGIDAERALIVYSMVTNLAMAWGLEMSRRRDPALQAVIARAVAEESASLVTHMTELAARGNVHRRSFELLINGLIP